MVLENRHWSLRQMLQVLNGATKEDQLAPSSSSTWELKDLSAHDFPSRLSLYHSWNQSLPANGDRSPHQLPGESPPNPLNLLSTTLKNDKKWKHDLGTRFWVLLFLWLKSQVACRSDGASVVMEHETSRNPHFAAPLARLTGSWPPSHSCHYSHGFSQLIEANPPQLHFRKKQQFSSFHTELPMQQLCSERECNRICEQVVQVTLGEKKKAKYTSIQMWTDRIPDLRAASGVQIESAFPQQRHLLIGWFVF